MKILIHGINYAPEATGVGKYTGEMGEWLAARGHEVRVLEPFTWRVGGGHGIAIDPASGVLTGGADPRRDGASVAF